MTTNIYIIRHGQTELNRKRIMQGRSDHPLNAEGVAQAEAAGEELRSLGIHFDCIWSSPLQRAVQTARIIAGDDTPLTTDEKLLEMDYGPYEGVSLKELPEELLHFFSDFTGNPAPEGMEPLDHIVQRLGQFLEGLREDPPGGNVLVATHAIAMKGALEYLTPDADGSYWSKYIGNCEIYHTRLEDGIYSLPRSLQE